MITVMVMKITVTYGKKIIIVFNLIMIIIRIQISNNDDDNIKDTTI